MHKQTKCSGNAIHILCPFFLCAVAGKSGQSRVTPESLSRAWFTAERKTYGLKGLKSRYDDTGLECTKMGKGR